MTSKSFRSHYASNPLSNVALYSEMKTIAPHRLNTLISDKYNHQPTQCARGQHAGVSSSKVKDNGDQAARISSPSRKGDAGTVVKKGISRICVQNSRRVALPTRSAATERDSKGEGVFATEFDDDSDMPELELSSDSDDESDDGGLWQ